MNSLVGIQVDNSVNDLIIEPYSFVTTIEIGEEVIQYIEINEGITTIDNPLISITEVAGVGIPGPPGPQGVPGIPGPPGPGGDNAYSYQTDNLIVSNISTVSYTLSYEPRSGSLQVFLNGLRENSNSITLSGNVVNFMTLELGVGDLLTFDYQYQVV